MSVTNLAVMFVIGGNNQGMANQELVPGPAATQATARRVSNQLARVTSSVNTGSLILPSIGTGEANEMITIVNDTAVIVNVYPATGEKMNGVANAAFQITANLSAVFIPVLNSPGNPTSLDWRATLIP